MSSGAKSLIKNGLYHLANTGVTRRWRRNWISRRSSLPVAVVLYHRVDDQIFGETEGLTVTRSTFDDHLRMYRENYRVISVAEMLELLSGKQWTDDWTVVITFDDGYRDNWLHAAPLLKKHGLPACFFLTAGYLGTRRQFPWDTQDQVRTVMMSWAEARELAGEGFEIGAHTVNHANLGDVPLETARQEARQSREILEEKLGQPVPYFSYPFGGRDNYSQEARQAAAEAGYQCAFTAYGGHIQPGADLLALPRIPISPYFRDADSIMMELESFFRLKTYL